jgi:DNA-binding MarR family transcriptional regulator
MPEPSGSTVTIDGVIAHVHQLLLHPASLPEWTATELTFGQLRLLFVLRRSGPVSVGRLAATLGVTAATTSELVDRLERHGVVIRRHRTDDRRVVECELSDEGVQLLAQIGGTRREALRQVLGVLTPNELAEFDRLLEIISARLAEITASGSTDGAGAVIVDMRRAASGRATEGASQ